MSKKTALLSHLCENTGTKNKAENLVKSRLSALFVASPPGFEPGASGLGGLTYPLEGVWNIRCLHKIRIFHGFKVKTKLFSVTFTDFIASPEHVAPRRVPKMAPFFQNRTKLLPRRRVARVFFCFSDRYIIKQVHF